jgi:SAM-dependent methyltransferase
MGPVSGRRSNRIELRVESSGNAAAEVPVPGNIHFDIIAPLYEIFIRPTAPEELIARLALPADGALLDAGGGSGRVAQFLRGAAVPIVVADASFNMLAEARAKQGLFPVAGFSECLPFPSGAFSRIVMVDALHHVGDQNRTAAELWRVLAPGGRLVIQEPDFDIPGVKILALAERLALMRSRFLPPDRMADLFRRTGAAIRIERNHATAWIIVDRGFRSPN